MAPLLDQRRGPRNRLSALQHPKRHHRGDRECTVGTRVGATVGGGGGGGARQRRHRPRQRRVLVTPTRRRARPGHRRGAGVRGGRQRCGGFTLRTERAERSVALARPRLSSRRIACNISRRDETCPVSTEGGTRRVQLVRGGGGGRIACHISWSSRSACTAAPPREPRAAPPPVALPPDEPGPAPPPAAPPPAAPDAPACCWWWCV